MKRSLRKYTNEFKQEAVNLALQLPSVSRAAQELGVPAGTLHSWMKELKANANMAQDGKNTTPDIKVLIEENRRLHKELAMVKEEWKGTN